MNFFRLRFINTLLLFFLGIVMGFILKEKFYPSAPPAAQPQYRAVYPAGPRPAPAAKDEGEDLSDEPYPVQEEAPPRESAAPPPAAEENGAEPAEELVIETPAGKPAAGAALKGEEGNFFARPADFEGRELEMELQMITAKKARGAWRLNLVYTGPGKKIDYLYIDDDKVLEQSPDLRIGYVYRVRFLCGKGQTSAGNTLAAITPTGQKAEWATGLSAVE
ncbi:MAG TPA: hypothetical protein DEQ38_10890 [Elusimicrobia bacterium]|nr:MAG: hypothetical protein A2089_06710 [Elusimicrobia bacterium GWD2_63_28]HCC48602.1 hypothetical protein [Elusimicrobiota bacterium]